jgi:hypothetical protein
MLGTLYVVLNQKTACLLWMCVVAHFYDDNALIMSIILCTHFHVVLCMSSAHRSPLPQTLSSCFVYENWATLKMVLAHPPSASWLHPCPHYPHWSLAWSVWKGKTWWDHKAYHIANNATSHLGCGISSLPWHLLQRGQVHVHLTPY